MDWSHSTKQYEVGVVTRDVMEYHVILLSTVSIDTCMNSREGAQDNHMTPTICEQLYTNDTQK